MITVSLNEIRAKDPCETGWKAVLKSKGGVKADMDAQFPMADIIESNGVGDALWSLRCRPEYSNLWRKYAVWCARQVEHLVTDYESMAALDVAWRHSNGEATDDDLDCALDAAWQYSAPPSSGCATRDAAWSHARAAARDTAWRDAWVAARASAFSASMAAASDVFDGAQKEKLIEILTAGEWVD